MLLGNYSVIHKSPGKFLGGAGAVCDNNWGKNGQRMAIYTNETIPDQWGLPVGYSSGWMLPRKAGYIVAFSENSLDGSGTAVMGVNGNGVCDITLSTLATLSLVVSSSGICEATLTMTGGAVGALYANGISDINLSATGTLGAVAFSTGNGTITLTASADIKALGQMTGSMSPFTELSPQGLAQAVWNSLATEYNTSGTMGGKLNTASSGGVDMNALAQAVWEYGMRSLTESAGLTTEQSEQLTRIDTITALNLDKKVSQVGGGGGFVNYGAINSHTTDKFDDIKKEIEKNIDKKLDEIKKDIQDIQPTDITEILDELDKIKKSVKPTPIADIKQVNVVKKLERIEEKLDLQIQESETKKIDFIKETDKIVNMLHKEDDKLEEINSILKILDDEEEVNSIIKSLK